MTVAAGKRARRAVVGLVAVGGVLVVGLDALEQPVRPRAPATTPSAERLLGQTAADSRITFVLTLEGRRQARAQSFIAKVSDGDLGSHGYLSPAGFARRFGASVAGLDHVRRDLARAGIRVLSPYPQRTVLLASGSAADVGAYFGVSFRDYRDPSSGARYHAPVGAARIPRSIAGSVASVAGLSDRPVFSSSLPLADISLCPRASRISRQCLTPSGAARAYDIAPLYRSGIEGEGETIAILSLSAFRDDDLAAYERAMGLPGSPAPEHILVAGGPGFTAEAGEANLDVDVVKAIAPAAQILDYEAQNNLTSFVAAINRVVADARAKILSISYGICDDPKLAGQIRAVFGRSLAAAAATGISIFVASGDQGAYACTANDLADRRVTVNWPASSPDVIAVGGTRLNVRADGSYLEEAGWEDTLQGTGSGGGLSPLDRRPSWQTGYGVRNPTSNGMRQLPDVSAAADPDSGFFTTYTDPNTGIRVRAVAGGTSAAAPFWAASMLLVEQYAKRHGVPRVGFVAPLLYRIARDARPLPAFHDVTVGGDLYHQCTPGWDYATGLGSPDVFNLARDVVDELRSR